MSIKILVHTLAAASLLAWAAGARAEEDAALAITANGTPVVELFRERNGTVRYQLNDDLALGMSLGVSPIRLTDHAGSLGDRWLPVFDLYEGEPSSMRLIEQSERESAGRRWFWTVGTHTNLVTGDSFDIGSDLVQHFSLQTKAGFLIPLGRRWLLGGAVTLDHVPTATDALSPRGEGTAVGAFLGLEFNY